MTRKISVVVPLFAVLLIVACRSQDKVESPAIQVAAEVNNEERTPTKVVQPTPEELVQIPDDLSTLSRLRLDKRVSHQDWGLSVKDFTRIKDMTQAMGQVDEDEKGAVDLKGFDLAAISSDQPIKELSGAYVWKTLSEVSEALDKQNVLSLAAPLLVVWGIGKPKGEPKFEIGIPVMEGTTVAPPLHIVKIPATKVVQTMTDRTSLHMPKEHMKGLPSDSNYQDNKAFVDDNVVKDLVNSAMSQGLNPEMIFFRWPWHGLHDPANPKTKFQLLMVDPK